MDCECNHLLNLSSVRNSRTKRHEAAARLKDHLFTIRWRVVGKEKKLIFFLITILLRD
ncbi:TraY domain-containing protein (plasmid) [Photobacterium leiognathi subsp. mandapamensis]|uniref:TraY domain-containing protein n=1 Tax=Photobacterium leiognathi TaxID=553611 RepID=UPI003AF33697